MNLKEFRISQSLNQKEMAKKIGVSPSFYYKVEAEDRNPSFEFMKKLKNEFPSIDRKSVV